MRGINRIGAPLPVDYQDYSIWMRGVLGDKNDPTSLAHRQLDYWATVLRGVDGVLPLPTDHPRPAAPTQRGSVVSAAVDGDPVRGADSAGPACRE